MNNYMDNYINNYNNNQIQIYNELLQLNANTYNKNIINELNLDSNINLDTVSIKQNKRKLFVKNFLIVFMLKMLYFLCAIIIPIVLYILGFISLKYSLILITIVILIYIVILVYTSNNNTKINDDIQTNNTFNFTNSEKINNFIINNNEYSGGSGGSGGNGGNGSIEENENTNYSYSNETILENNLQNSKNIKSFYYDNSLPYKFYI